MSYIKFKGDPSYKQINAATARLCDPVPVKKSLRLIDNCFSVVDKNISQVDLCDFSKLAYPADAYSKQELEICQGESVQVFSNGLVGGTTATGSTLLNSSNITLDAANSSIKVGDRVSGSNIPAGSTVTSIAGTALTISGQATSDDAAIALTFVEVLNPNRSYVKGIILYANYPTLDDSGAEIEPSAYSLTATTSTVFANGTTDSISFGLGQAYMHFAPEASSDPTKLINSLTLANPSTEFSVKVNVMLIKTKTDVDPNNCNC